MWLFTVMILEHENRKKSNEKLLELKIGIIAREDINILIYQIQFNRKSINWKDPIYNHKAKFKLTENNVLCDNKINLLWTDIKDKKVE